MPILRKLTSLATKELKPYQHHENSAGKRPLAKYQFTDPATKAVGEVHHFPHHLSVTRIKTPVKARGQGGAKRVMQQITEHLDKQDKPAVLRAIPDKGSISQKNLMGIYSKFGFKSSHSDGGMTRQPTGKIK